MRTALLFLLALVATANAQFVPFGFIGTNGGGAAAGGGSYTAYATKFATPADYLSRGNFTGEADGKTGIISCWGRFPLDAGGTTRIFWTPSTDFVLTKQSDNTVRLEIYDAPGSVISLQMTSTATTICDGSWHHVLMAWDSSDSTKCKIAVDGTVGTTVGICINSTLNYTVASWQISTPSGSGFDGDICEFYYAPVQWLDITVAGNVQKFRSVGAKPVDLGSNGSTPTGTAPIVYLKDPTATFGNNSGTGGNFTVNGAPTSTTPP